MPMSTRAAGIHRRIRRRTRRKDQKRQAQKSKAMVTSKTQRVRGVRKTATVGTQQARVTTRGGAVAGQQARVTSRGAVAVLTSAAGGLAACDAKATKAGQKNCKEYVETHANQLSKKAGYENYNDLLKKVSAKGMEKGKKGFAAAKSK